MNKRILAMYDVRGIQKYIFQTAKVKDAMGASSLVENIIVDALKDAVEKEKIPIIPGEISWEKREGRAAKLGWYGDEGPFLYRDNQMLDVEVLFVGGGNAYVFYKDEDLCVRINRHMSRYVQEQTYSLQLAVAFIEKGDNYSEDYQALNDKMASVKANMIISKPLGALPVMKTELKTGYPLSASREYSEEVSTESLLKKKYKSREAQEKGEKQHVNLTHDKGTDSLLAVVHLDGNNMGLRIREMIHDQTSYEEAVNRMRLVSNQIRKSYRQVFDEMSQNIQEGARHCREFVSRGDKPYIRRIVTAGDDITYVCTAKIALASVEYFCREISKYTLNGKEDQDSRKQYGFSVCAGVAFLGSHFPFSIGYEVAESCCDNAKKRAKEPENMDHGRVGNFVDFQYCRNIQTKNLERLRNAEYITSEGNQLLIRPYYIPVDQDGLQKLQCVPFCFGQLKKIVKDFQDEENKGLGTNNTKRPATLPRSFAKQLRNTYPLGKHMLGPWMKFLKSRGWGMPDGTCDVENLFDQDGTAKWYDALEMMDDYIDLERILEQTDEKAIDELQKEEEHA